VPLDDFFHALPLLLLVGTFPGLALATLIAPGLSWPERVAAAPGFSVGCVGAVGLLLHLIGVPFTAIAVVPVLVALVAGALVRHLQCARPPAQERGVGWVVTGIAIATGAVLVGLAAAALHGEALPPANDPALHGAVAASIARDQDVLPVIPMPLEGSGFVRPQAAFEATDALASDLGAGAPAKLLLPLAALSLLALPLGVALLAFHTVPDRRVAAGAAVLSLGLMFPASPLGFGDYPYIVDSTLVVPLILATARLPKGGAIPTQSGLIAAAVLSIWITHGLEIVTAAVIGGPLWLAVVIARRRAAIRPIGAGLAAAGAAAVIGYLLTRPPAVPAPSVSLPAAYDGAAVYLTGHTGATPISVLTAFTGTELSLLSGLLLVAGLVVLILRRRGRWLIVALVLPLLCIYDVLGPEILRRVWTAVYPWSVEDRLLGLEFFVVPVIAAVGAVAVIDLVRRIAGEVPPSKRWRVTALSAGLATLMAAGALVAGGAGSRAVLSWQLGMNGHVASRDVAVIQTLGALLRPGSIVLNDGVADDGRWITALTDDVEAEPKPHTDLYPNDWRLVAMAEACTDPAQAERALAGVQAVFVGSDPAPGAAHVWRASCIAALPDVHLVAGTAEGPAGFVVTGGSAG